jgi:hypothetical protein
MPQKKSSMESAVSSKGGIALERYVVRIYRRDPTDEKKIAGTVECSGGQGRTGFMSSDALVNILALRGRIPGGRAESPSRDGTGDEFKSFSEILESIRVELEGPEF